MASSTRTYWDPDDSDNDIYVSMISRPTANSSVVSATGDRSETSTTAPPPTSFSASNTSELSSLVYGEVSDKGTRFVPFELMKRFPMRFVGKSEMAQVAQIFDHTLQEDRTWDVFSVCDPMGRKNPLLLVPTTQFEQHLDTVSSLLNRRIYIPRGKAGEQFSLTFGEWDTPRPRFLERVTNAGTIPTLMTRAYTLPAENFSHLTPACYQMYYDKLTAIYCSWNNHTERHKKVARKRIQRRKDSGRMLKRVQRYLGLRQTSLHMTSHVSSTKPAATNWDFSKPAPFRTRESVRFVCVDVEADEQVPSCVTEIGLAVLDTEDLIDISPGERGENWFPLAQAHHLRIKERCHIVNSEFVQGCPEAFDFGKSQIVPMNEIKDVVGKIIGDKESKDERSVIIVGHDVKQDLDYLRRIGYEYRHIPQIIDEVDTKDMLQRLERSSDARNLATTCAKLGIFGHNYHNAGNDAVYTLQAMIAMAIKRTVEGSGRNEDSFTPGTDEWSDGDMDDGGCPKISAPPVEHETTAWPDSPDESQNVQW
ncbi:hypothetical protein GGR51DRAFT_570557 [Nemania sp. FL0031]|nr:hypothetical protein GGR51DRAFT_570557 [Nemania sp. FL0031]